FRPAAGNRSTDTLRVNLGPVSTFFNAAGTAGFSVGNAAAVTGTFSSLANLDFSVSAANQTVDGTGNQTLHTIWETRSRADVDTQSNPWNRQSNGLLSNTSAKIASLGNGATTLTGINSSAVVIPLSDTSHSVSKWVGSGAGGAGGGSTGNFQSTFQGNAENKTPSIFGASDYVRSDFYEIVPGSGASTYLGFFQFNGDGSSTFTPVPEPQEYAALAGAALIGFALWRRACK
ncbi:MAG TPA: hypothetical protein VMB21_04800, partial [Candidatus Limnocylindria bacterium]|nr:hypothetical protein [Candidatus Limnocylindria bacterium]